MHYNHVLSVLPAGFVAPVAAADIELGFRHCDQDEAAGCGLNRGVGGRNPGGGNQRVLGRQSRARPTLNGWATKRASEVVARIGVYRLLYITGRTAPFGPIRERGSYRLQLSGIRSRFVEMRSDGLNATD